MAQPENFHTEEKHRLANRYSIAVRDFEKAQEYLEGAAKHQQSSVEFEALLLAAIVAYCRPFSNNEKEKKAKALSKLCLEDIISPDEVQLKIHRRLVNLRNKALAHSEFSYNPTQFDTASKIYVSNPFSLSRETIQLQEFQKLVHELVNKCHHKRADLAIFLSS